MEKILLIIPHYPVKEKINPFGNNYKSQTAALQWKNKLFWLFDKYNNYQILIYKYENK
jgi:hypothetical protein